MLYLVFRSWSFVRPNRHSSVDKRSHNARKIQDYSKKSLGMDVLYVSSVNQLMIRSLSMHWYTTTTNIRYRNFPFGFRRTLDATLSNGNNSHPLTNDCRMRSYNRESDFFCELKIEEQTSLLARC